jgi:hypothetical protein
MTSGIEFRLSSPIDDGAPTYAQFAVLAGGEPLWPIASVDSSVDIFIDDVLDYLTDFWAPLLLRQTYPLAFSEPPERPSALHGKAASRWLGVPESQAEHEQSLVGAFEEAHNLATCFDGQFGLPPLWLLRDRDELIVDTQERLVRVRFNDAIAALTDLGNEIARRLEAANVKSALTSAWRSRDDASGVRMVELKAGLSTEKAEHLIHAGYLSLPGSLREAANDNDEIVLAARMAGALPLDDIKRIIKLAKGFAPRPSQELALLGENVRNHIARLAHLKPFDQGEAAARMVRSARCVDVDEAIDVRELVEALGIEIKEHRLSLTGLMGLAISGPRHGPGVLLNTRSHHLLHARAASRRSMLRYTLAHELCHLLLDSGHSFTAVDVLSGRMNPALESRAQSFAGELLMPTRLAAALWERHGMPVTQAALDVVLTQAVERYQVTRSVAAWKLEHAARAADVDLHAALNALAQYR